MPELDIALYLQGLWNSRLSQARRPLLPLRLTSHISVLG